MRAIHDASIDFQVAPTGLSFFLFVRLETGRS